MSANPVYSERIPELVYSERIPELVYSERIPEETDFSS